MITGIKDLEDYDDGMDRILTKVRRTPPSRRIDSADTLDSST